MKGTEKGRLRRRSLIGAVCIVPIMVYRGVLSPMLPRSCRYEPSCSRYAIEAIKKHGAVRGLYLAVRRILRCRPLGGCGYDPVPPMEEERSE